MIQNGATLHENTNDYYFELIWPGVILRRIISNSRRGVE